MDESSLKIFNQALTTFDPSIRALNYRSSCHDNEASLSRANLSGVNLTQARVKDAVFGINPGLTDKSKAQLCLFVANGQKKR